MNNENTGLNISEDRARQLVELKEKNVDETKNEMLSENAKNSSAIENTGNQQEQYQPHKSQIPPPGVKTRDDLKYTNMVNDTTRPDLGKASIFYKKQAIAEKQSSLANEIGMKPIPLNNLPSGGLFYEPGTEIAIRAARVEEIRHFSTIDESDIIDLDDKLNYIIERCARIRIPGVGVNSYKDILEIDRFYLVFAIRELTFSEGENKIQMKMPCQECQNVDIIDINRDHFHLINLDEKLHKFFNPDKRCFSFKTKTGEEFDIFFATLGVTEFIKRYIKAKAERGQKFDQAFLTLAPFLFKDWRLLTDASFNDANHETLRWSLEKMSIMFGIIEKFRNSGSNEIIHQCSVCGTEVRQPITFPGGYKSLFIITDIFEYIE